MAQSGGVDPGLPRQEKGTRAPLIHYASHPVARRQDTKRKDYECNRPHPLLITM
jgi:hypothetical protein